MTKPKAKRAKISPPKPEPVAPKPKPEGYTTGRPTLYGPDVLESANDYFFNDGYRSDGHSLPMFAGLAVRLGVAKSTLYKWAAENKDFSDILERGKAQLEIVLSTGATVGGYNPTFSGLIAANALDWRSSKSEVSATVTVTERPSELTQVALGTITST